MSYTVTIADKTLTYETLADLRDAYGRKSIYTPDCGTIGDILIRHPLAPQHQFRAIYTPEPEDQSGPH